MQMRSCRIACSSNLCNLLPLYNFIALMYIYFIAMCIYYTNLTYLNFYMFSIIAFARYYYYISICC